MASGLRLGQFLAADGQEGGMENVKKSAHE
jgi:hypothetical protein